MPVIGSQIDEILIDSSKWDADVNWKERRIFNFLKFISIIDLLGIDDTTTAMAMIKNTSLDICFSYFNPLSCTKHKS